MFPHFTIHIYLGLLVSKICWIIFIFYIYLSIFFFLVIFFYVVRTEKNGRREDPFNLYLRLSECGWMEDWLLVVKLDTNIWLSSVSKLEILLLALYVACMFCGYFISSLSWMISTVIYSELRKDNYKFITICLWYHFYRWMKLILDMCAKSPSWGLISCCPYPCFGPSLPKVLLIVNKEKNSADKKWTQRGGHIFKSNRESSTEVWKVRKKSKNPKPESIWSAACEWLNEIT